jgi:hypothetical protein
MLRTLTGSVSHQYRRESNIVVRLCVLPIVFPWIVGSILQQAVRRRYRRPYPQFAYCHGRSSDESYAGPQFISVPAPVGHESDAGLIEGSYSTLPVRIQMCRPTAADCAV